MCRIGDSLARMKGNPKRNYFDRVLDIASNEAQIRKLTERAYPNTTANAQIQFYYCLFYYLGWYFANNNEKANVKEKFREHSTLVAGQFGGSEDLVQRCSELSIKHAGIESGLFTMKEARARQLRSGHGIEQLATLAVEKLGGNPFGPIVRAITCANTHTNSAEIVKQMICGHDLAKTRESYASRRLGYGQVFEGDFAIIRPVSGWIESVKETAVNLPTTIDILSQWKASASTSKHFAIWLRAR